MYSKFSITHYWTALTFPPNSKPSCQLILTSTDVFPLQNTSKFYTAR